VHDALSSLSNSLKSRATPLFLCGSERRSFPPDGRTASSAFFSSLFPSLPQTPRIIRKKSRSPFSILLKEGVDEKTKQEESGRPFFLMKNYFRTASFLLFPFIVECSFGQE